MTGTNNLRQMEIKRVLPIFIASVAVYSILDYVFNNMMLYIMGGVVGGTIGEAFKAIGVKAGIVLICLVWLVLLIGLIVLFYKLNNNVLKYLLIILIAAFLYVIDMAFAGIPYPDADAENIRVISNVVIGVIILLKSLALSWIIYTGIIRN